MHSILQDLISSLTDTEREQLYTILIASYSEAARQDLSDLNSFLNRPETTKDLKAAYKKMFL